MPPVRLNVPIPAWVKLPPRLTVEFVALMVPVLLQVSEAVWLMFSVPPPPMLMVPLLAQPAPLVVP